MFAKRRHQVPGLNTTSTADISFMLLIFFLVTTNMDVDKGLGRQLPPSDKQEQQVTQVVPGTVMNVAITADNVLLVDGKPTPYGKVCGLTEAFVRRVGKQHLVRIEADPEASYDSYFQLQNELVKAYRHLRNEVALKTYGTGYERLSAEQRDHVRALCPQRIAEDYGPTSSSTDATTASGYSQGQNNAKGGNHEHH